MSLLHLKVLCFLYFKYECGIVLKSCSFLIKYKFNLTTGSSCSYMHNVRIFVLGTGFANHFLRASRMLSLTNGLFSEVVETIFF